MSLGRALRIAYVTDLMAVGGIETNLVVLGEHLRRRGHDVVVVSSGGALEAELRQRDIRHIRLPVALRHPVGLVRAARRFTSLVTRERIDIVHAMSAAGNLVAAAVPRYRVDGCRFVSSPMGLQNSDSEIAFVTTLRNRLLTLRADRVLVISQEIGRAVRSLGVSAERIRERAVVGVDLRQLSPRPDARQVIRAGFDIPQDAFLVVTVGALHKRKRHDLFLRAARIVLDAEPAARFLIVGEGAERSALEAQSSHLGLGNALTLTGLRRDVHDLIAASDVYVKPGIVEGFIGITVLEAQAAGRPTVAFDTSDVHAAIADRETGLLAANGDPGALAAAILELRRDPVLAEHVSSCGRRHVEERFAMEVVAAGLELEYLDLLSQPRRQSSLHARS